MSATSTTDLDGLFKTVYGATVINLIPETAKLVKEIQFSEDEKIGDKFVQPVALTYEHGYTYGAPAAGAFTLRSSISMKMKKAEVDGYQGVLRAQMDYETAAKASSGGVKAFKKATQLQVENMMESATKRLELSMLYGQTGLGKTSSSANVNATRTTVQVTTATWATGIWSGMENCPYQFFDSTGALVSSGTDSVFTIHTVDVVNRRLTVNGTAAGITALDIAAGAGVLDIYFDTARADATTWSEMVGLDKIISNTSSTLFGINAGSYNLWAGNVVSAGSADLTLGKILRAVAAPVGRGLSEKLTVYLNDRTWANVANDQAALRKYDASYSPEEAKNGYRAIRFYSQNGELELQPYNCIKEGEAFGFPLKRIKRIGAQDISFSSLGAEGRIFRELSDSAGFEYRLYTDQSVFVETPAKCLKINEIVNT